MSLKKYDRRRPGLTLQQELDLYRQEAEAEKADWIQDMFYPHGIDMDLEEEDEGDIYADVDPLDAHWYEDPYYDSLASWDYMNR